ncbi:hypothetical protein JB92DRAFT_2845293 [Gautieria morchelliformis]|nr:hypothetical protein JB92DRAFT_2845293 [Gautieria morchelliformis]
MSWDEDGLIYLSSSTSSSHARHGSHYKNASSSSSTSDVVVLTDSEDDDGTKRSSPPPARSVLSVAELTLPGPSVPADPYATYSARVLEIIPDVDPAHLRTLLEQHYLASGAEVVENVLHVLFEDASYPRVAQAANKRKRSPDDDDGREKPRLKLDYASKERIFSVGPDYHELAISHLMEDFPWIPKHHIRTTLGKNGRLYAPTHLFLAEEENSGHLPYTKKTFPSRVTGKRPEWHDPEFDKERAWLVEYLAQQGQATAEPDATADSGDDEECEDGIECGCCFSKFPFDRMVQCPEAHLFCRSCCRAYASTQLGQHDHRLRCMDQSGCKELFHECELARFLPEKLLALYHRLKQQKEIAAAELEGLEECPFCEYKVVIENPDEKLFRCESADCGEVSCRACKKPDHLPKSCKEVQDDKHLSVRHFIEEAMTKALMRNCPKCNKGFVKENGCNKMICPNCHTVSCYICREVIVGYNHFGAQGRRFMCNLWDPVELRHDNEVIDAAKKAMAIYKAEHPDVDDEALKVDLPAPVANAAPAAAAVQQQGPYGVEAMQMEGWAVAQMQAEMHAQRQAAQIAMQQRHIARQAMGMPAFLMPHGMHLGEQQAARPQGRQPAVPPLVVPPRRRHR